MTNRGDGRVDWTCACVSKRVPVGPDGELRPAIRSAMPATPDEIVPLDLGASPDAGVSDAVCLQTEYKTFLTFSASGLTDRISPYGGPYLEDAGTAVVEFTRCLVSRFGYPNDEARRGIPRYRGVSYGIYEVRNSTWIKEVVRMNPHSFPQTRDDYIAKHYLFAFHDGTFECLADGLRIEIASEPYHLTFERIRRRVFRHGAE
jgi:hypothetical protein